MNAKLSYDFLSPQRIVFGWGRRREVGVLGRTLGHRAFLVCGLPPEVAAAALHEIADLLRAEGVEPLPLATLLHEPEVADVDRVAADIRGHRAAEGDFLLAVGGGAAIDLAKATAAMATNGDSPTVKDYLEGVGRGLRLAQKPLPVLAMPSTAGTGAEATKNAVISSYDPPFKKSLRDDRLVPRIALVDPQLTVTVPPSVTAASGMDAITQLIESYVSRKSQPIPRALAVQGLRMAAPAIVEAVEKGSSQPAREAMSHAALLSGMALANSGLGMAHGVAAALGTHCRVPHGAACAADAAGGNSRQPRHMRRPTLPAWPTCSSAAVFPIRPTRPTPFCRRSKGSVTAWACPGVWGRWVLRGSRFLCWWRVPAARA